MAHRLAAQISRDRRLAEAEVTDFIEEGERFRAHRDRERQGRPQEIVIRVDDGSRSPFDRSRRAEIGLYEPRRRDDRDRYALVPESTLREIRLREEEEAYLREREIAREVVREELRAQIPPRRREPRPLLDLTTGDRLYEEVPRRREPIYNYVQNTIIGGERRRPREAPYEELVYVEDDLGVLPYDDHLIEEARIRREADEYARYMRQRREDEFFEDLRRHG